MKKGIKFRAYPNREQKNFIDRTLGCCRLVYNKYLAIRKEVYTNNKERIGYNKTCSMLTELKKSEEYAFLHEADSVALQQSLKDLDRAFQNFFKKRTRYPRFKSKVDNHQSYRTISKSIRIEEKCIKLPKLGLLRIEQSMEVRKINNVTVEKTSTGKYFVILNVDFEPGKRSNKDFKIIGIDVGIKEFYTDSNGNSVDNPKYLEKLEQRLCREQRKLSRKKKGSNNCDKQRIKVAKIHEKIRNQRNDFLQKQSTILINENQTICVESLNIKGMLKNKKLAKHISSVAWSKFFDMLEYKASWYGNEILKVPTMYPSSQICSHCGYKNPIVKNLSIRKWECPMCHTKHNRDKNASINILKKCLDEDQKG